VFVEHLDGLAMRVDHAGDGWGTTSRLMPFIVIGGRASAMTMSRTRA
jgi:hypothetical protein